jgi:hypothetical protein
MLAGSISMPFVDEKGKQRRGENASSPVAQPKDSSRGAGRAASWSRANSKICV